MNSIRATFLAVSALALLGTTAAQAESYEGVHAPAGALGRSTVQAEAARAASARDQNVVRGSRGAETVAVSQARAAVQAEAVRTAAAPRPERELRFAREQPRRLDDAQPGRRARRVASPQRQRGAVTRSGLPLPQLSRTSSS